MGIVMNMGSYAIEHDEAVIAEYDEEILCSGWNPAVALMCQQYEAAGKQQISMPASLAVADADAFLEKMYAFQR